MLTPPSRRRPWELASQVATVDRVSTGRVTLSVGLGATNSGFETFGEECDRKVRSELMDECLDIMCGLWAGQPFGYSGTHYTVQSTEFPTLGNTVQQPRVPIWCVGALGRNKSMRRALRWDGIIPQVMDPDAEGGVRQPHLDEVAALRAEIAAHPDTSDSFDVVVAGQRTDHVPP